MKMEESPKSGTKDTSFEVKTYIDCSHGKGTDVSKAISDAIQPLTEVMSNGLISRWYTVQPPFLVLAILQDLGFPVVAANTVGETTVWTLQGNLNVRR